MALKLRFPFRSAAFAVRVPVSLDTFTDRVPRTAETFPPAKLPWPKR